MGRLGVQAGGPRRIAVRRTVGADIESVWDALADLESHVEWMADARAIRFTSRTTEGVGTTFECDTRIGPFALVDRMEVTEWEPPRAMSVRHVGIVGGEGRFSLQPRGGGTELRWEEVLRFPWWIPSLPAALVLKQVWRLNLRRFERTIPTPRPAARRRGRRRDPTR